MKISRKTMRIMNFIMTTLVVSGTVTFNPIITHASDTIESEETLNETSLIERIQKEIDSLPTVEEFKMMSEATTVEGSNLSQKQMDVYKEAQNLSDELDKLTQTQRERVDCSKLENLLAYFNGETEEALTLDYSKVRADALEFYSNGNVKGINLELMWPSSNASASVNLVLLDQDIGNGDNLYYTYYGKYSDYETSLSGVGGVVSASQTPYEVYPGATLSSRYSFGENEIPINVNKTYYLYLWSKYGGFYYPDAEIMKIKVQDGKVYYSNNLDSSDDYNEIEQEQSHSWKYAADRNTIEATCEDSSCKYHENGAVLQLNTPDMKYNGESYEANVKNDITKISGETCSDVAYYETDSAGVTTGGTPIGSAPKDSGYYYAEVALGGATARSAFSILKADIDPSVSISDYLFGENVAPIVTGNPGNGSVAYEYKNRDASDDTYKKVTDFSKIPIGEYTLKAEVSETKNYNAGEATCDFTVTKNRIHVNVNIDGWTYGDKENKPFLSSGSNPGKTDVSYTYYKDSACTEKTDEEDGASKAGAVPSFAGTYYVKADVAGNEKYESGSSVASFVISQKKVKLEWDNTELTYNGKKQLPHVEAKGIVSGDKCSVDIEGSAIDAGQHVAMAVGLSNKNYVLNSDDVEHEFTIVPKKVTISIDSNGGVYGTVIKPATAEVIGTIESKKIMPTLRYVGRTNSDTNYDSESVPTEAGDYEVKATINDDNYQITGSDSADFKIKRANPLLCVTENYDKNYGDDAFYLETNSISNGKIGFKSLNNDVATVDKNGQVLLKNAGTVKIKVTLGETPNYASETKEITLTVKKIKHDLTVSKVEESVVYGDEPFKIDATVGDHEGNAEFSSSNPNVIKVDERGLATIVGAGKAEIIVSVPETGNHMSVEKKYVVTVLPKTIGIEFGNDDKFTYDGEEHAISVKATGLIGNDRCSLAYTGEATNVGSYVEEVVGLDNPNYKLPAVGLTKSFTIEKKTVLIEILDAKKHIGEADPAFSYEVSGLVRNDKLKGIKILRESGENSGTYALKATFDADSNYDVKTKDGKLTIEDHKPVVLVKKSDATCVKDGNTEEIKCSVCGKVLKASSKIPSLGHDWSGSWKVIKKATATENGLREKICLRDGCGQKKVEIIPVTGFGDNQLSSLDKDAEVEHGAPIKEATLENTKSSLFESSLFSEQEKNEIRSGKYARVWIEISKTDTDYLTDSEKKEILKETEEIAGKNVKVTYFDVDLFKQIGGIKATQLHEPGELIKISIKIPDELINHDATINRQYRIIRLHKDQKTGKNVIDTIKGTFKDGMFTFETNKFSTYAIVYKDVKLISGVKIKGGDRILTKRGETEKLEAEAIPVDAENDGFIWKSSNESVATVDRNGVVTAVGNGETVITASTVEGGKSDSIKVKVKIPDSSLSSSKFLFGSEVKNPESVVSNASDNLSSISAPVNIQRVLPDRKQADSNGNRTLPPLGEEVGDGLTVALTMIVTSLALFAIEMKKKHS